MSNSYDTTQNAFMIMERLAALVATPGVNEETIALANEQIQTIIKTVVKGAVTGLSAKSAGLMI